MTGQASRNCWQVSPDWKKWDKMPDLRPFTHRIYVDFSGDDGDPGTIGASKSICIAWVMSREEDISHNESVVLEIKKLIGCKRSANLKYVSLKRHKFKKEALTLLTQLKASIVVVPVLKEMIKEEQLRDPQTKLLVDLIHYFPLDRLIRGISRESTGIYFQLVFDQVGWKGCKEAIENLFKQDKRLDWKNARKDWLLFTKSGNSLMLQLADIVAGMSREYFEDLQLITLPPCNVCWIKRTNTCAFKRKREAVGKASLLKIIYPMLAKNERGDAWDVGFVVRPPGLNTRYLFVDCLFKK